jgi:hypothetical protein
MYVTAIRIEGFADPGPDGLRHGAVALEAGGARMLIPLSLPLGPGALRPRHRRLLLALALSRARRQPDLRAPGRLRFAPGLLPPRLRHLCA